MVRNRLRQNVDLSKIAEGGFSAVCGTVSGDGAQLWKAALSEIMAEFGNGCL
jgi:hypothetical protein